MPAVRGSPRTDDERAVILPARGTAHSPRTAVVPRNPAPKRSNATLAASSVENLIRYHMALKAPVYEDVILKSYVVREQWQLYHEQVLLDFDA
ncbi:unnamed protein product [Heligmosomoides polygyrus]|uniref:PNT domain-containing protein n=1 Tax=Heligmosomoides polygyrus TaxID=6339 RepID=A0A183F822_HELPZ|nr:unnamed protein product [Heligmosomoides polygyrus]